ncbi:MAG: hypothetical protein AAF560_09085 [Acidobacteriota bacterium]
MFRVFSSATLRPVLVFVGLALSLSGSAAAQCDSLNNGSFNVGANWSCGFVPGPTNTVRVFHSIDSTTDVGVDSLDVFPGGVLTMNGFPLEIEVSTMVIHPGGTLTGGPSSSIYITSPPGLPFDITNDGVISAGAPGGDIFIHDGGPGGDLPCPSGSRVTSSNGAFLAAGVDGNVYILADQVDLIDAWVEAGSGSVPYNAICRSVAGSVYIAGVTVILDGNTQIYQGLNSNGAPPPVWCPGASAADGSVNVLALACNSAAGILNINGSTVVGHPMATSPSQCATVFGTTSIIAGSATINGSGAGCVYWDPPLLALADDATLEAGDITVAGEDLDASGLAARTLPTPALDAADTLEIRLQPGGELNLQNLTPGNAYFQAGSQIIIAADEDQILTDPGVALEELMDPAPELVRARHTYVVTLNPDSERQVTPGSTVEHPIIASSLSTGTGLVELYVEDSEGWLQGGPISVGANRDPGEALLRTLTLNVPASAAPGTGTVVKAVASINGGPPVSSVAIFRVAKPGKGRGSWESTPPRR